MSKNKQSSIEWLYNKMYEHRGNITIEEYEQAKAMHKEEIVNACNLQRNDYKGMPTFNKSGEQYYNETFGGKYKEFYEL